MDFSNFIKREDLEDSEVIQEPFGLGIHYSMIHFNDSFNQYGKGQLHNFINTFRGTKKWILSSDYAFYNKNKNNDVVTFSLFPHTDDIKKMSGDINKHAPVDIKKAKSVNDEFITFLSDGPVFNISIILDRNRRMHSNEKDYFLHRLDMLINLLHYWSGTTPEQKENYQENISKLEKTKRLIESPGVNLRIFRDIEIIANLAAFILTEASIISDLEIITWISDRDSMLSFKQDSIGDYLLSQVHSIYHILCLNNNYSPDGKLLLVKPDLGWNDLYDSFIRIPDYIAGTLADFDFKTQKNTHGKFEKIKNGTFAAEDRNLIYELFFHPNFKAHRHIWGMQQTED